MGTAAPGDEESSREFRNDIALGVAFLILSCFGLQKLIRSFCFVRRDLAVVTYFYMLYAACAVSRAAWFLIPSDVLEPSYSPRPVYAFQGAWVGTLLSELLLAMGSMALFALFILLIVMWADLLQRLYNETVNREKPMTSFVSVMGGLLVVEGGNVILFMLRVYSSEGMILLDAILFAAASVICIFELSKFSHRIRKVLVTMMNINEVSYENQIFRILCFTIIGNLFFLCRATVEAICAVTLLMFWHHNQGFGEIFSSRGWDIYILVKHWSEVAILALIYAVLVGARSQARNVDDPEAAERGGVIGFFGRMYQRWQYRKIRAVDEEVHGRQHTTYGAGAGDQDSALWQRNHLYAGGDGSGPGPAGSGGAGEDADETTRLLNL